VADAADEKPGQLVLVITGDVGTGYVLVGEIQAMNKPFALQEFQDSVDRHRQQLNVQVFATEVEELIGGKRSARLQEAGQDAPTLLRQPGAACRAMPLGMFEYLQS